MTFWAFYFICVAAYAAGAYMLFSHIVNKDKDRVTLGEILIAVAIGLVPIINLFATLAVWGMWILENHSRVIFGKSNPDRYL